MSDVQVCPECSSPRIDSRCPGSMAGPDMVIGEWYCDECKNHFDEPDYRPRKSSKNSGGGMQHILLDKDPEDWP